MPLRGLFIVFAVWLGLATPAHSLADAQQAYKSQLLQSVVRLQAVPQSAEIAGYLQLLHALVELDLGMTDSASKRLQGINGGATAREMAQQFQLFRAQRLREQGSIGESERVVAQLPNELPGTMERERQFLRALQLFNAGEHASAIAIVSRLRDDTLFLSPITLDLALMHAQTGETSFAITILQLLGNSVAADEHEEQVRDRANLALARLQAMKGLSDAANGALERVRLNGRDGADALLLSGWLRLELSGSESAMVPWMELSLRSDNNPAVMESKLAVAMALAHRRPDSIAYKQFEETISYYQQRLVYLEKLLSTLEGNSDAGTALAVGREFNHGGSRRAAYLAENHDALVTLQRQWRDMRPDGLHDVEDLRRDLLVVLQQVDGSLAGISSQAVWRESYARLLRHLQMAFEGERVSTGKLSLNTAPFAAVDMQLDQALVDIVDAYRHELQTSIKLQKMRINGYLEQAGYAVARMNDAALVQGIEGQ